MSPQVHKSTSPQVHKSTSKYRFALYKSLNFLLLIFVLSLAACVDDDFDKFQDQSTVATNNRYEGGTKLENPYTTANMKMALDTIKAKIVRGVYTLKKQVTYRSNSSVIDNYNITTSHRYIKFTPQSEEEIALLKQDSTLYLADYPLDYEFDDSFFDNRPTLAEGEFPEYFASVPAGQSLPNVSHQQLAELYIPEEDNYFNQNIATPVTKKSIIANEEDLLHHLLFEAYALVGKEQELLGDSGSAVDPAVGVEWWFFGKKLYPSGTLQVWDGIGGTTPSGYVCHEVVVGYEYNDCATDTFVDVNDCVTPIYQTVCEPTTTTVGGFVPLHGAQVLMRQWFTIRQGITDENGNFSTGSVRGKARYVIQWERYQYSIRNGSFFQAETRGPKEKNARWNKNIKGDDDEYHAMIHTAAHEYYYMDRFGTMTPPTSNGYLQMKIAARQEYNDDTSSHSPWRYLGSVTILPQIVIKKWGDPSDKVYGTTIHELAHAAHWNLDPNSYSNIVWDAYTNVFLTPPVFNANSPMGPTAHNNRRLMETWPTTIETLFALRRYRDQLGLTNYAYTLNNFQNRTLNELHYTSAGIDMIEGNYGLSINNQGQFISNRPIDRVNGYTINQLEAALIDASSWWEWRDRIYGIDPNNPTRDNLVELFDNW